MFFFANLSNFFFIFISKMSVSGIEPRPSSVKIEPLYQLDYSESHYSENRVLNVDTENDLYWSLFSELGVER